MKKIFLVLLVLLGLQTQAQINICDSSEITITVNTNGYVELETNLTTTNFPQITSIQSYTWGKNGCLMGTKTRPQRGSLRGTRSAGVQLG